MSRRFFVEGFHSAGSVVEIAAGDAHKIARVLRLRRGDAIEIIDSTGTAFTASIEDAERTVRVRLVEQTAASEAERRRDCSSTSHKRCRKGDAWIWSSKKPPNSVRRRFCRSIANAASRAMSRTGRRERWQRIARSAAQQCGRRDVPFVADPLSFDELLERFETYDVVLFPWELAPQIPLRETLPQALSGARTRAARCRPRRRFCAP